RLTAIVERIRRDGPAVLPLEASRSPALLAATRLTAADDRLRDLAARLPASAVTPLDRAEWICDQVHASVEYADGVTSVRTTAAAGRDYSDGAPTSGSYVGTSGSRLTAQRQVGVLAAA